MCKPTSGDKSEKAPSKDLFGPTGGFQPIEGGWYLGDKVIPYKSGSLSDMVVESFAGTHDYIGGEIWGWYGKDGNTSTNRTKFQDTASTVTTVTAIPVAAPFALADLLDSNVVQLLFSLGR